jgi:NlpC/P60 family putative phage cell wall peptidase
MAKRKKVTRSQIVAEARTWLNTPFHHQGRRKSVGVDCAGVVIGVANALGLSDFDTTDYAKSPSGDKMRQILETHMDKIAVTDYQIGDVLHLVFDVEPQHVAIVSDIGIIHAYAQVRKCVETSLDMTWQKRIRGAYRFKGVV